jgi:arsenate reductase
MAEGLVRRYFPEEIDVYSAGIKPTRVHPFAILVMQEEGIDISEQYSKSVSELRDINFDVVITLCDNAHERCPVFPAEVKRYHINFPDPLAEKENTVDVVESFRGVRNQIKRDLIPFLEKLKNKQK